jgi:hypothetical protein
MCGFITLSLFDCQRFRRTSVTYESVRACILIFFFKSGGESIFFFFQCNLPQKVESGFAGLTDLKDN